MAPFRTLQLSALAAVLVSVTGCSVSRASDSRVSQASAVDREIHLSIYSGQFGQVHENRKFDLNQGRNRITLPLISKRIDSQTLVFDSTKGGPDVLSTTSDLGMANQESIVSRLAGTEVEVVLTGDNGKLGERIKGILESRDGNGYVLRTPEKTYINPPGTIVVDKSASLSTMQGLNAEVDASKGGNQAVGFSYLSRGLSWSADYVLRLGKSENAVELESWATIQNQTSVAYPDAQISLVAGQPNQIISEDQYQAADGASGLSFRRATTKAKEEISGHIARTPIIAPVGDLQSYEVPAKATILPDQLNRVRLVEAREVPVKKDYLANLSYPWYANKQPVPIETRIRFRNDKASGLGFPLAAGAVRVLENSAFVGAANMSDTPKDLPVELPIGNAFDITADMTTISTAKVDKRHTRADAEVVFHNRKVTPVTVVVRVSLGTGGEILSGVEDPSPRHSYKEIKLQLAPSEDRKLKLRFVSP